MAESTGDLRPGMRASLPLLLPTVALGFSFGVLAAPVMGALAASVMSVIVFSAGAQFAATSVLDGGGTAAAAIAAGLLMNARFLPMSFAMAPSLRGGKLRRAAEAQTIIDASFVIADTRDGRFDRNRLLGATLTQGVCWIAGTVAGALVGDVLPDPGRFGIDVVLPAFFLALLVDEARARGRDALAVIAISAAVTLALLPVAPAGVPVVAAAGAALLGLRRARA